ncbi:MAG: cation/H(+) antiporter, partial [Flavobacteriales bacterium]|nr:cation/H(+) antiporter [Flavobacteriales bacterium]
LGVMSPEIFAMMVIMALVTTFMTGPLLSLIERVLPEQTTRTEAERQAETRKFQVLVPFGDPERGRNMVRLANAFVKRNANASITALHLSPSSDLNPFNTAIRERESFSAIRRAAAKENMRLETLFRASTDIDKDVVASVNSGLYDMAIVGVGRSIYQGTVLGRLVGITSRIINPERLFDSLIGKESLFERTDFEDRIRQILRESRIPLGIYVDKELETIDKVVVPLFGSGDSALIIYAQKLVHNQGSKVTFVDMGEVLLQSPELLSTVRALQQAVPDKFELDQNARLSEGSLKDQNLMLISLDGWKRAVDKEDPWLAHAPSTLIMRP